MSMALFVAFRAVAVHQMRSQCRAGRFCGRGVSLMLDVALFLGSRIKNVISGLNASGSL